MIIALESNGCICMLACQALIHTAPMKYSMWAKTKKGSLCCLELSC